MFRTVHHQNMLSLILFGVAVASLFYYYFVKPLNYWKERGVAQGKPKLIFGDNWGFVLRTESAPDATLRIYNEFPDARYSGIYQFTTPVIVMKDPELIKRISVKDFDHFTDHRIFFPDSDPLWNNNLLSLKGQQWRDMRATLSPAFTSSKMKTMFDLMQGCAENFIQYFQRKSQDTLTVEMKDIFTRFTNDVIATTAFGVKVDSLAQQDNEFYLMGKEATDFSSLWDIIRFTAFALVPKMFDYIKMNVFTKNVDRFFRGLIDDTIKAREEKGIIRPDMIHLLMEARKGTQKCEEKDIVDTGFATAHSADSRNAKSEGKEVKQLTNEVITAQALIFFFAGFESVSTLMCFTSYELATNPDIQDKLRKEVLDTLEECGGKLTYESLLKMKYMDMVITESLRKWPSFIDTDRICTKPYTIEPENPGEVTLTLDEGTVILFPTYAIQRDPKNFPDPDRFDPERFSDENKKNIKPFTYFPFGLGQRNCIGSRFALLETKLILFHILANYKIIPIEKSVIPIKLSKKSFQLECADGFWFGLKPLTDKI